MRLPIPAMLFAFFLAGRGKVEVDAAIRQRLSEEIFEDIDNLQRNITSIVERLDKTHTKEILKLSKMQHGRNAALVYMYPSLTIFDPALPKLKRFTDEENNRILEHQQKVYWDSDDEDEDQQIDYKMD